MPDETRLVTPHPPASVAFALRFEPDTPFYFLQVDFGGRLVEVEGYVDMMWIDEDLPRAALMLAGGRYDAFKLRLADMERGGPRLWVRAAQLDDPSAPPSATPRYGAEISREYLDHLGDSEGPPEVLGVTPSIAQFVQAALDFSERRHVGRRPSPALLALREAARNFAGKGH